jgi:hypothetical protein
MLVSRTGNHVFPGGVGHLAQDDVRLAGAMCRPAATKLAASFLLLLLLLLKKELSCRSPFRTTTAKLIVISSENQKQW